MSDFGKELDNKKIMREDGFYTTLKDFKRFMVFVLSQYLLENNTYNMFYDPLTNSFIKDDNYISPFKKIISEKINLTNIGFSGSGFLYSEENGELAVVSPEFFMIHLLDSIKKSSAELYGAFLCFQEQYGNDVLDSLSFKKIHESLYNQYRSKSEETEGLYRLTEDYSETYLRAILLLKQIEETIDDVEKNILGYFSEDFYEWNDERYVEVEKEIEDKLNSTPRNDREEIKDGMVTRYIDQDYVKLINDMQELREKEVQNAYDRYRKEFAENQKIAASELIRILQDQFKELVVSYSYEDNEYKRGYITDLGIDEVLYYAHPKDKYNNERLHDIGIGSCAEDYDGLDEEEPMEDYETVVRQIYM